MKDHPEVVAYDDDGNGLVPCVVLRTEIRNDGMLWVLLSDRGYEHPDAIIALCENRSQGLFWQPESHIHHNGDLPDPSIDRGWSNKNCPYRV